jgi:hypothetical protein
MSRTRLNSEVPFGKVCHLDKWHAKAMLRTLPVCGREVFTNHNPWISHFDEKRAFRHFIPNGGRHGESPADNGGK